MTVSPIGATGFTPYVAQTLPTAPVAPSVAAGGLDPTAAAGAGDGVAGADFGQLLTQGMDKLQGLNAHADTLALKAATGDLTAIHDYTIAATEASVATQLTTAVRNKALESFQEIMRMSV